MSEKRKTAAATLWSRLGGRRVGSTAFKNVLWQGLQSVAEGDLGALLGACAPHQDPQAALRAVAAWPGLHSACLTVYGHCATAPPDPVHFLAPTAAGLTLPPVSWSGPFRPEEPDEELEAEADSEAEAGPPEAAEAAAAEATATATAEATATETAPLETTATAKPPLEMPPQRVFPPGLASMAGVPPALRDLAARSEQ